jgi:hypothetical protein
MTRGDGLELGYRRLLRCYPRRWRDAHEDEMISVLLDQAEAEGRAHISLASALDLIGHGTEARLEVVLRRIPVACGSRCRRPRWSWARRWDSS